MDETKLLKKKKKAVNSSNRKVFAEACGQLGAYYFEKSRFSDALDEFKDEAKTYKQMGLIMEWGSANRMIAETYMMLEDYQSSLTYELHHLDSAKTLNNLVEEQRALATLGRIYLTLANTVGEISETDKFLEASKKAFMKSLELADKLQGKVTTNELKDMRARSILNISIVLEQQNQLDKAIDFITKATSICIHNDLFETQFKCHMLEANIRLNNNSDTSGALNLLNKALEVAKRLDDKVSKQCEALTTKAEIFLKMGDYQSAKQVLYKAWKLKTPDEEMSEQIEKNLKIVASMCYTEDRLISCDPCDHHTLRKLHEKLGDGACALENYSLAIDNYLKMLEHAEADGNCEKNLIPIYVSLYQTYKDMGDYNNALKYCEKEYELIKDEPREAFTTLLNMAEMSVNAKKPYELAEKTCLEAINMAKLDCNRKNEIKALKYLLSYQETYCEYDKMDSTKDALKALGCDNFERPEDDQSSTGCSQDQENSNIGDDICLEDLTDLSANEEENDALVTKRETRKRGRSFAVKKNAKGETQLHVACISGKKLLVERLLASGHPVNVRDNAGWLPIHEACNNGHADIVNMLIDSGAHINDRGGVNCDGTTPLYDAAVNGHLEIVQLLLNKGAITSLRNDEGNTPLDALRAWRARNVLDKDDENLFNIVCNKMSGSIDKSLHNRSKSITPAKNENSPSCSKSAIDSADLPSFKRRNILFDSDSESLASLKSVDKLDLDDNSNSSVETCQKGNEDGVKEYRKAILALRNRNPKEDAHDICEKKKNHAALIETEVIDDDWLEDDLLINKSKKRKFNENKTFQSPDKDTDGKIRESRKAEINLCNKFDDSNHTVDINKVIDRDSDCESNQSFENINPYKQNTKQEVDRVLSSSKLRLDSRKKIKQRLKRQTTLLKSGFIRKIDKSDDSSASDCEMNFNIDTVKPLTSSNSSPNNFPNTYDQKRAFRKSSSSEMLPLQNQFSAIQSYNVIQPLTIAGRNKTTQIMPQAPIRVEFDGLTLLISLNLEKINNLKISWLVEEAKNRYYKAKGIRPIFSLMTPDGAILSEDDPLSLVLSSPVLKTSIATWKASPAEERYIECCDALGIATSEEIQQAISRTHTTHRLSLAPKTLNSSQIRPLFRALTHQNQINSILISNNNLGDDGLKYLVECISTLKNLTLLDLSKNNITSEGLKHLYNMFDKATRPTCQSLEHLNISCNPIKNKGFGTLCEISQYVKLKILKLSNCGVTEEVYNDVGKVGGNFDYIECIDLSNNCLKQDVLAYIILKLNPNVLVELELENVGIMGSGIGVIAQFLDSAQELRLRKFKLTHCSLTDAQFMRIFRTLGRAKNLQSISLKYNAITFITLKKLLQRQPPVPHVELEGCGDVFKYAPDSDFQVWLPAIDFGRCVPIVTLTPMPKTDQERDAIKLFNKTWLTCFKGRALIEHGDCGVIKYTAS